MPNAMLTKNLNVVMYGLAAAGAALCLFGILSASKGLFVAGIALLASAVIVSVPIFLSKSVPRTRLLSAFSAAVALLILIWLVVPSLHQTPVTAIPLVATSFVLAYVWWRVERGSKRR